ncbi:MAG: hypothetical protein GXP26_03670 [Planctomycetes bacterium]|nr:hypothetical protein [Planctomycetota bacterium]
MELSTFDHDFDDDLLDLSDFAKRLEKFIKTEHQFVQGSLVLALSSKFGSGKTTFLKMWKSALENGDHEESRPLVISLNAWESDYYGDPLFAIISSLVKSIEEDSGNPPESLISAAKDIGWFATGIGGQIVRKVTGVDPVAAGKFAEEKKSVREAAELDTFSIYQGRKKAMGNLQVAIKEFVEAAETRVLFLVDELDRCRPDYAISYLETIKHIFDMQGAVFILAADRQQLENSAKTAFGPNLDFEEYYRKFVHREIALPPISETGYKKLASAYVSQYLEQEGLRNCFMEIESHRVGNIVELVAALKLTPRQIQEVFRILGHAFETSEEKKGRLLWCIGVGSIAMAAFKVSNRRVFHLLGSQQFDPKEAFQLLTNLLGDRHADFWFALFLTGGGLKVGDKESDEEVMTKAGLTKERQGSSTLNDLGQFHQGWGDSFSRRFVQIHEKIEQISQWN